MTDDRVIVIGSGPCGASAAARLVDRGLSVLMLDAGRRAPRGVIVRARGNTLVRRMGWRELSTSRLDPASSPEVEWFSSLSLGGLSNFWTAAVPRFAPQDFHEGARLDERYDWPISYDDLVPYYEASERMLTITAGGTIPRVPSNRARFVQHLRPDWRSLVDNANRDGWGAGLLPMAKGRPWMAARRGTEFCSYHCVIKPMLGGPRFELRPGAHVVKLNYSAARGAAESVEYVDGHTKRLERARARAFVVAAGAIDSTVLLLRSRCAEFPSGLGDTHGVLGRYLHDHPREWWTATPSRPMSALAHPVYISRADYESSAPLLAASLTLGLSSSAQRLRTYYGGAGRSFGTQVFGTMVPTDDLGVRVDQDAVDQTITRPVVHLRYDDAAVANLVAARQRLRDVFASSRLGLDIPGPFHEPRPGSSVHYGGSIRMHANPEFSVLDGWNRVHDVPNVVVADSSCFTTGPEKNPTLTAMALATRAADRLAADLMAP